MWSYHFSGLLDSLVCNWICLGRDQKIAIKKTNALLRKVCTLNSTNLVWCWYQSEVPWEAFVEQSKHFAPHKIRYSSVSCCYLTAKTLIFLPRESRKLHATTTAISLRLTFLFCLSFFLFVYINIRPWPILHNRTFSFNFGFP